MMALLVSIRHQHTFRRAHSNRWLGVRLDLMGAILIFLAALLAVLSPTVGPSYRATSLIRNNRVTSLIRNKRVTSLIRNSHTVILIFLAALLAVRSPTVGPSYPA